jgi:hypothetical protein
MDSRQSLCDFGNDGEDNRKQNEPDSRVSSTAIQKKLKHFNDPWMAGSLPGHDERE